MIPTVIISRTHLQRARQKAAIERLGLSWEHWRCPRCHGNGVVEISGTGKYDSDNDWGPCPEDPPESQWGPSLRDSKAVGVRGRIWR